MHITEYPQIRQQEATMSPYISLLSNDSKPLECQRAYLKGMQMQFTLTQTRRQVIEIKYDFLTDMKAALSKVCKYN